MSDAPVITVLLTVYNALPYLEESLRSILDQTFREFEFLIIDDGSTDGSVAVLERWAAQDTRIRLVANPANQGQTPCLNQGLALARGHWIARQDADDLSHPRRLERQLKEVRRRPYLGLLGTNGWTIDAKGQFTGLISAPLGEREVRWTACFKNPFIHTSALFRRDAALEVGGYDPALRIVQDYDLWIRLMAAHPADNLPDRLVTYRVLPDSLSNQRRDLTEEEADRAVAKALALNGLEFFDQPEVHSLIRAFRAGLPADRRADFWGLYRRMCDGKAPSLHRATAFLHWKAAGALLCRNRLAGLAEITAAFRHAPILVAGYFKDRLFPSR